VQRWRWDATAPSAYGVTLKTILSSIAPVGTFKGYSCLPAFTPSRSLIYHLDGLDHVEVIRTRLRLFEEREGRVLS
jgi:hypothetical protein